MNDTGFNIAKAKFFGVEPEDKFGQINSPQKQYAEKVYDSPPKVDRYYGGSQTERSAVGKAGNMILRSSSTNALNANGSNPNRLVHPGALHKSPTSPTHYTHK